MKSTPAFVLALLAAATQAYAQQRYTCESAAPLPDFDQKLRLVLAVPDKKVLADAALTLTLLDRERRSLESLSDSTRTAAGVLTAQIGNLKPHTYPFVILNYSSDVLPQSSSNSLRGFAIDKPTSTALSLSIFSGKEGLEFVAFDQLLAPVILIRGKCVAA
jgi:hypothetical protein